MVHCFKTNRHIRERTQAVETVKRRASQSTGRTAEIPGRDLEGTNNTWKLWK